MSEPLPVFRLRAPRPDGLEDAERRDLEHLRRAIEEGLRQAYRSLAASGDRHLAKAPSVRPWAPSSRAAPDIDQLRRSVDLELSRLALNPEGVDTRSAMALRTPRTGQVSPACAAAIEMLRAQAEKEIGYLRRRLAQP